MACPARPSIYGRAGPEHNRRRPHGEVCMVSAAGSVPRPTTQTSHCHSDSLLQGSSHLISSSQRSERTLLVKHFSNKLTYSNVVATLALFLVIAGGSAFAASKLGKNSVGTKQLKNNAVSTAKIKKEAVTGPKIKLSTLGTVPSATNATHAATADSATNATHAAT